MDIFTKIVYYKVLYLLKIFHTFKSLYYIFLRASSTVTLNVHTVSKRNKFQARTNVLNKMCQITNKPEFKQHEFLIEMK